MKLNKAAFVIVVLLLLAMAAAFASTFFLKNRMLEADKTDYYICAADYPTYSISRMIINDVPNMHLSMLTQPQIQGYTAYELSNWDKALLEQADAIVYMGDGFESFDTYTNDIAAIINLLSLVELEPIPDNCTVLDFSDEETAITNSPWLYITPTGALKLCETMCGSMAYLDQAYSSGYYLNLDEAYALLTPLIESYAETEELKGLKVAVAHDALLYTAKEFGADVRLYIRRSTGQTLSDEEIDKCIEAIEAEGISVMLIEKQENAEFVARFELSGITVIQQDLMLDMAASFGFEGLTDAYLNNIAEIKRAFAQ